MGQGHYVALGYGAIHPLPQLPDDDLKKYDDWEHAVEAAAGRRIHTSYESECKYLAIFVAENFGVDDDAITLKTCLLSEAATGPEWDAARAAWERVRAASEKFDVVLPPGHPLLIVDYD